ncbi:MAG: alpha/beta hydrolase, partial [Gemmatimonadaceae bacterium]
MPKLFLHSPTDVVIPYEHGQRLYAAAQEPKRFVTIKGGHIVAFREDSATYFSAVHDELLAANVILLRSPEAKP